MCEILWAEKKANYCDYKLYWGGIMGGIMGGIWIGAQ